MVAHPVSRALDQCNLDTGEIAAWRDEPDASPELETFASGNGVERRAQVDCRRTSVGNGATTAGGGAAASGA
jgi:hypothetical protein